MSANNLKNNLVVVCPECNSDDTIWSNKKRTYGCEDCGYKWEESETNAGGNEKEFCESLANLESWSETVVSQWPAVISHEYRQLKVVLESGQFITSIFQMKDLVEVIIKFSTLVMYKWITQFSPENSQIKVIQQKLFEKPLSLGGWLELLRMSATTILDDDYARHGLGLQLSSWFYHPANSEDNKKKRHMPSEVYTFLSEMVVWRNEEIGHGALNLDTSELWSSFSINLKKLHELLQRKDPWADTELYGLVESNNKASKTVLSGWESIRNHRNKLESHEHQSSVLELFINYKAVNSELVKIPLSPYIQVHVCKDCNMEDIFMFDSLKSNSFHHLDYLLGHRTKVEKHESPELTMALEQANLKLVDSRFSDLNQSAVNKDVVDLLNAKSIEADYIAPVYIHKQIDNYFEGNEKGIFWLMAPAHLGKSLFVHGLEKQIGKNNGTSNTIVVKFHIRREFRYFAHHFLEGIAEQLKLKFNITSGTKELPKIDLELGKAALVSWINEWWEISPFQHSHRLVLAIDGLDEIGKSNTDSQLYSILDILPTYEELNLLDEDIFIILTSRPIYDCPRWMQDKLFEIQNYAEVFQVDLHHEDYLELLHQYFKTNLKTKLTNLNKADTYNVFNILLEKSEFRFLYFSLLVNIIKDCNIDLAKLKQFPEGDKLYAHYIQNLEVVLGSNSKQFMRIKQFLTLLTACEQAEVMDQEIQETITFSFNDAMQVGKTDLQRNRGDLYWKGLSLSELAGLLGYPEGEWSADLIFTMYSLKSLLKVNREGDSSQYRLGLKDLSSYVNKAWSYEVENWHYKLGITFYRTWSNNWNSLDANTVENKYQLRYLLAHTKHIVRHYVNNKDYLIENRPDAHKFYNQMFDDRALSEIYIDVYDELRNKSNYNEAFPWINLAIYCTDNSVLNDNFESDSLLNTSALYLRKRGGLFILLNNTALAIADLEQARARSGDILFKKIENNEDYPIEYEMNNAGILELLASLYGRLGNHERAGGLYELCLHFKKDMVNRVRDYDNNVPYHLQWGLASSYCDYAVQLSEIDKIKEALDSYEESLRLVSELISRDSISEDELVNTYTLYNNIVSQRGSLYQKIGRYADAQSDFELTRQFDIKLHKQSKESLNPDQYQAHMVSLHNNRGREKSDSGDYANALDEFNKGVQLGLSLREKLSLEGCFPNNWKDLLVKILLNRANLFAKIQDIEKALTDYNLSIKLGSELYEDLTKLDMYPPDWQNALSAVYLMRSALLHSLDELDGAEKDINKCIELREDLYNRYKPTETYQPDWQFSLANAYATRAIFNSKKDNIKSILIDYQKTVHLLEDLISNKEVYPYSWENLLSTTLYNRGNIYNSNGYEELAINDFNRALEISIKMMTKFDEGGVYPDDFIKSFISLLDVLRNVNLSNGKYDNYLTCLDYAVNLRWTLYQKAINNNYQKDQTKKDFVDVFTERAKVYGEIGHTDKFIKDFDIAISLYFQTYRELKEKEEEYPHYWANAIVALLIEKSEVAAKSGKEDDALKDYSLAYEIGWESYEKYIELDDFNPAWPYNLAVCNIYKSVLLLNKGAELEALSYLKHSRDLMHPVFINKEFREGLLALVNCQKMILENRYAEDKDVGFAGIFINKVVERYGLDNLDLIEIDEMIDLMGLIKAHHKNQS